mmetsp:Transcript_21977/g.25969  ORF Transcript_21977/g.25969 Transcript_21977/m.25969 type:complete len:80 (-) Transcript_21977:138-377(-)
MDREDDTEPTIDISKLKKELKGEITNAHADLWKAQELVDSIVVHDEDMRQQRKLCVNHIDGLMNILDKLKTLFQTEEKR